MSSHLKHLSSLSQHITPMYCTIFATSWQSLFLYLFYILYYLVYYTTSQLPFGMNPGLVVSLSGAAAFMIGVGVHMITRSTTINTGIEKAMDEERLAENCGMRVKYDVE